MSGFNAAIDIAFRAAMATLFDATCDIERVATRTSNGRFGYATATVTVVANDTPCSVQHGIPNRSGLYADRLGGRVLCAIYVARTIAVRDKDTIKVSGGDTYEVVGPPHLDGDDDPVLFIPVAAAAPVTTNP